MNCVWIVKRIPTLVNCIKRSSSLEWWSPSTLTRSRATSSSSRSLAGRAVGCNRSRVITLIGEQNATNGVLGSTYLRFGAALKIFGQELIVQQQIESEEDNSLDGHAQQVATEVIPLEYTSVIIDAWMSKKKIMKQQITDNNNNR